MSYDEGFIEAVHDSDHLFSPILRCSYDKLHIYVKSLSLSTDDEKLKYIIYVALLCVWLVIRMAQHMIKRKFMGWNFKVIFLL